MRRLLVLLGVLVALGPMVADGQEPARQTEAGAPTRTDTRYFLPFGPDGLNPALTASATVRGTCGEGAIATPHRPDAFDCLGEDNRIYDPCFEHPFAPRDEPGELACAVSPFANEVVLLAVDGPLPREKEDPLAADPIGPWDLPWALELANGDRCTLSPDAPEVMAGAAVHYGCERNGIVVGEVDHGRPVWTVQYLAAEAVATELVDVTVAWS